MITAEVYLLTHMIVKIPQETSIKVKIVEEVEARQEVLEKSLLHLQFMLAASHEVSKVVTCKTCSNNSHQQIL